MYFCLGCLACMTACPAGVNYAELFEHARAEAEESGVLRSPKRNLIRAFAIRWLFMDMGRLQLAGGLVRADAIDRAFGGRVDEVQPEEGHAPGRRDLGRRKGGPERQGNGQELLGEGTH